jgi:hypothetical protein
MNGPMSVDGGAGDNVLDIVATEPGDHLVLGESTVDGAGLDHAPLDGPPGRGRAAGQRHGRRGLGTAPGVITLVVGGLGSDAHQRRR